MRPWSAVLLLFASRIALAEAPQVSAAPTALVLGSHDKVSLTVRAARANQRLRGASNTGTLQGPDDTGSAERHFTWTPPSIRFPMTALLVFWAEERGSPPEPSIISIPLSGRTALEINTEPGALVRVQVANATFGPRRADKRGRLEVPIEVPPGVQAAQVIAEAHGRLTTRAAPLEIPHASTLALALSPDPVIAGEPAWLIVARPGALDAKQLDVEVDGGRVAIESDGPGRAIFRLLPAEGAHQLKARAALRGEAQERAEATSAIISSAEAAEPSALAARARFFASASAGGFYAGGANSGAALAIDGSYGIPNAAGRLSVDLELGFRSASLSAAVQGLGSLHSTVSAMPIEVALRALLFERGRWTVYGRVGGGAVPFQVSAHSDFQPPFTQSGLAAEGFASAQVGYRVHPVELFAELRGGLAPAKTSTIDAQLGGLLFALGARYQIR